MSACLPALVRCLSVAFALFAGSAAAASVVELYHAALDHYFITASAEEAAAISGAGQGWVRTGETFESGGAMEVCRFYGSVSPGPNSHFYTVDTGECSALKALQLTTPATERRWNYEGSGFLSSAPVSQVCAPGTVPVYRAYNQGYARTIDSNHRIVANRAAIAEVVARGWVDEGVVMCAPPPGASDAPAKVFALMDPGDALDSARLVAYAARDNVDGLAVRLLWSSIESGDGRYNWTALDNALVAVRAQGKRITLHIAASDGAWPSWLPGIGAQT